MQEQYKTLKRNEIKELVAERDKEIEIIKKAYNEKIKKLEDEIEDVRLRVSYPETLSLESSLGVFLDVFP